MHRLPLLAFCVALSGGLACGTEPEPDDGYIEFVFENDTWALCQGTEAQLQSYVAHVFDFFEAPIPEGFEVSVYVVDEAPCFGVACYLSSERRVYTKKIDLLGFRTNGVLRHEVTHAVSDRLWGQSAPFLEEGLAESLSWSRSGEWASSPALVPVGDMLGLPATDVDYTAAARFSRFLIDTRGLDTFKKLFQGAGGRSGAEIMAWMEEVYGESFAALEAEFLAGPPRCTYQVDICDIESAEPVDSAWAHSFAASCDDPEFYGSVGPEYATIATQRTIEVTAAGTYRLTSNAHLYLARCGGCDVQRVSEYLYGVDAEIELEVGFYTLELVADGDGVLDVELVAR